MNFTTLIYSESRMVAQDYWVKMGVIGDLNSTETVEQGFDKCKSEIDYNFNKGFPGHNPNHKIVEKKVIDASEKGQAAVNEVTSMLKEGLVQQGG